MIKLSLRFLAMSLLVLSHLCVADTIRIGVEDIGFHPHYWLSKQGEYSGFAREFFDQFAKDNDLDIEYIPYPPDQLLTALLNEEIDLKYPDNPLWGSTAKEGKPFTYSEPIVLVVEGTLVNPRRKQQGLENIETLGTIRGFTPWIYSDQIQSGTIKLLEYDDLKSLIRASIKNEINAIFFNVVVLTYFVDNLSTLPFLVEFDETLPDSKSEFHVSSSHRPDLVSKLTQFMSDNNKFLQELKSRYEIEKNLDNDLIGLPEWKIDNDS
jgi:ABC-type amino acid transport substrate-binding protein